MIPTPGLSDPRLSMNASSGGFSSVESIMAPQMQHPKQYIGNQNSRMMQNIGGQMGMGVGMRTSMQPKSSAYGFPGGVLNGGLTAFGNNMPLMSGTAHADGYLSSPAYVNSQKPPQQHFDQQRQQQVMHSGLFLSVFLPLAICMYMCVYLLIPPSSIYELDQQMHIGNFKCV